MGLALILTFFIMEPTVQEINEQAYQPYEAGEIDLDEALERGIEPLREFMYPQTQVKDVELFMDISDRNGDGVDLSTIPMSVLLPVYAG